MRKTNYDIDGKAFHVAKQESQWIGWFVDDPDTVLSAALKRDVLEQAGYRPKTSYISFSASSGVVVYSNVRTMQESYESFRERLARGIKPKIPAPEKPLHKFNILARDNCACFYCGNISERTEKVHLDHIIPVGHGGEDVAENIVTACSRCNLRKSDSRLENEVDVLREVSERNRRDGIPADQPVLFPPRMNLAEPDGTGDQ